MKNIVAVGNCQMFPIVNCLRSIQEVNEVYSIFHARPVHVISKENLFEVYQKCSECDILICNFVNKGYRNNIGIDTPHLISLTPQNAKIILLPSIHWEGQNPELFYLKKEDGSVCTESFDYHNKIIFFSYLQGFSIEKTTEYLLEGENVFLDKIFLEIANKNLFLRENNLRERESHHKYFRYYRSKLHSKSVILDI